MRKYTQTIMKFRKPLFALFVLLNLTAIFGIFHLKLSTDFSMFTTSDSAAVEAMNEIENTFQTKNSLVIVVEDNNNSFEDSDIVSLSNLQNSIKGINDVAFISEIIPSQIITDSGVVTSDSYTSSMLESYYTNLGEFSPIKHMDGKTYYVISVYIEDSFGRASLKSLETVLSETSYTTYLSGDTYNQLKIVDYILQILIFLPPLTILLILLVFRSQLGSMKATLLSVLPAGIGSLWTLGIIGLIGNEVSILTAIVPIFVIVIGSADGLHFLTHYQEGKKAGLSTEDAIYETLRVVGIPMIITTLTSMVGFLSLLSMNTSSIIDLAVFATLGIFLAGVATWYLLPLILSGHVNVLPKKPLKEHALFTKQLRKIWGLPSYVLMILIVALTFIFYPKISNEFNMLIIYKDSTVVSKNADMVSKVNGGSVPVFIEVSVDDVTSLAAMNEVDLLSEALTSSESVDHVMNPYAFFNIISNMTMHSDVSSDIALGIIYQNALAQNPDMINSMINTEENKVKLIVFPVDLNNATLDSINEVVSTHSTDAIIAGPQYILKDLNDSIFTMQLYSIIIAVGAVFVMLWISLRSLKIAAISVIPIVISVLAIYAFLGITGIPLNITTVMIFSITIGVGIDYAVHYSSVYRLFLKEGHSKSESVDIAYSYASRPIIANALGVAIGETILMLSPLQIHFNVSVLMWVGMITSVLMTLSVLPTILKIERKKI